MENSCGDGAFLIKIVEKYCEEFLLINNDKMDYVIGNPPYVRIHDLNEDNIAIKKLNFSKFGMTDLLLFLR